MLRKAKHPEVTDDIKFQNKCTSITMLITEINCSSRGLELISFQCWSTKFANQSQIFARQISIK